MRNTVIDLHKQNEFTRYTQTHLKIHPSHHAHVLFFFFYALKFSPFIPQIVTSSIELTRCDFGFNISSMLRSVSF